MRTLPVLPGSYGSVSGRLPRSAAGADPGRLASNVGAVAIASSSPLRGSRTMTVPLSDRVDATALAIAFWATYWMSRSIVSAHVLTGHRLALGGHPARDPAAAGAQLVGRGAVAAGQHVVQRVLQPAEAGAVSADVADDVRADVPGRDRPGGWSSRRRCPGSLRWSRPGGRGRAPCARCAASPSWRCRRTAGRRSAAPAAGPRRGPSTGASAAAVAAGSSTSVWSAVMFTASTVVARATPLRSVMVPRTAGSATVRSRPCFGLRGVRGGVQPLQLHQPGTEQREHQGEQDDRRAQPTGAVAEPQQRRPAGRRRSVAGRPARGRPVAGGAARGRPVPCLARPGRAAGGGRCHRLGSAVWLGGTPSMIARRSAPATAPVTAWAPGRAAAGRPPASACRARCRRRAG